MAGLYIHIPFCKSKCRYCDFTSFAGREKLMAAYVERLCKEMEAYSGRAFDTVFIGGGTPSCLPVELMEKTLAAMGRCFNISGELSCEMNPGTVSEAFLRVLKNAGFNRVSMGMQAKNPDLLNILGRTHRFEQVVESVALCRKLGFENINIDLMFGIPTQTVKDVEQALQSVIDLGAAHVSCYGLIVEENTALEEDIRLGRLTLPDEELEREMYDLAIDKLVRAGLKQYEISNFARPGFECRHNIGYWKRVPYLGVGLAAHSLENEVRFANTASLSDYLNGVTVVSREIISPKEQCFETLMLGLRMNEGVPLGTYENSYEQKIRSLEERGLVKRTGGMLSLTRRGMDVQNAVLVELMPD